MDFEVLCPCCGARLKFDTELKAIIDHEAPKVARKFGTVDEAMGALKTHDVEREKKFEASVEAEKSKKDVLNRKFDELFEKTKGDTSKPIRDIDLD
jgi:viroplasmin and RNaseH domain-containing protein